MKNYFDEMNSVRKSSSTICDIYHHVLRTPTTKVNAKKETAGFNIHLSLQKIYK